MVNRLLLLSTGDVVEMDDLCEYMTEKSNEKHKKLSDMEREHILKTLEAVGGHKGKAAEMLGIDPKTLYRKLQGYGIKE